MRTKQKSSKRRKSNRRANMNRLKWADEVEEGKLRWEKEEEDTVVGTLVYDEKEDQLFCVEERVDAPGIHLIRIKIEIGESLVFYSKTLFSV
jgi:hypothetical protein